MVDFDHAIPPGGRGKITLKVDTAGYKGSVRKSAEVETNDPDQAKFEIVLSTEVAALFDIKPWPRVFLSTALGKPMKQVLTLTKNPAVQEPVEIVGFKHDLGETVLGELAVVDKGKVYTLTLETKAEAELRKPGQLILQLTGGPVKELKLMAFVDVWRPKPPAQPGQPPSVGLPGAPPAQPAVPAPPAAPKPGS